MVCKICGQSSIPIFKHLVLKKYDAEYYQCTACGFIQTEEPYWLKEAYETSLNIEDTGIVARNLLCAKRTGSVLFPFFNHNGKFLDYGGGTGLFVRIMRDIGFDFYWYDPHTKNIFARGFEYDLSKNTKFDAVTSFECFEHFTNPLEEIEKMLSLAPSIIFSTEIFKNGYPSPDGWKYYHFSNGQHIALYSLKSLQVIAEKHNLNLLTNQKSFHVLTPKKHSSMLYQAILKASVIGLASILSLFKQSKIHSDSSFLEKRKYGK